MAPVEQLNKNRLYRCPNHTNLKKMKNLVKSLIPIRKLFAGILFNLLYIVKHADLTIYLKNGKRVALKSLIKQKPSSQVLFHVL